MQNIFATYLENEIQTADPLKLVQMLYGGALDATAAARKHLAARRILERSQAINKALAIVHELGASLDHEKGGDLSKRLAALYDYIARLLIDANVRQIESPLIEAEQLLSTLSEAWNHIQRPAQPEPARHEAVPVPAEYRSISYAY